MLCEEVMTTTKARSALSVPQSTKHATPTKTQSNIGKPNKHYTNCGMTITMWKHVERRKNKPRWQP